MPKSETLKRKQIAVLISGNGSNLQALIDACNKGVLNVEIKVVISSRSAAYGLLRAQNAGIETKTFSLKSFLKQNPKFTRKEYNSELIKIINSYFETNPDLVFLAGWMLILDEIVTTAFKGRIINLHPAFLGEFDGADSIKRAYEAFQRNEITRTGVVVHEVNAEVDSGKVIVAQEVPIFKSDTLETLEDRIHKVEHKLVVEAVRKLLA